MRPKPIRYEKHIYISRNQLYHDFDAQLSIITSSRRKDDGSEEETLTNGRSKFLPMFNRWIDKYIGLAKGRMAAYVMEKDRLGGMDSISTSEEVDILLSMPDYYDATSFPQLIQAVHDYVVNGVMYEYCLLSLTSKDPVTESKKELMEYAYHDIKRYVSLYVPGTVKKPLSPF